MGRRGAAAAIVAPHGWPRGYVASDKGSGGRAEARCRGRATAAEISTRSRQPDRGDGLTEEADGGGRLASGQEEDSGWAGRWVDWRVGEMSGRQGGVTGLTEELGEEPGRWGSLGDK